MEQNMLTLLTSILSGQSPAAGRMQQPVQTPTNAMPRIPMRSERPDHGNSGHNDNPNSDGDGGDKPGGGKGGGNGSNLSDFEKLMNRIAARGPKAFTKPMQHNVGIGQPTIGYGKADPSSFKTGMATVLSGVPTPTPTPTPTPRPIPTPGGPAQPTMQPNPSVPGGLAKKPYPA